MLRRMLLVLFAIVASTPLLAGQDLPIGRRVRLTLADSSTYVGRVDSAHDARIWLEPEATLPRAVDINQVNRVEVSRGRKPKFLLGAALGAGLGLVTGLVLKQASEDVDPEDDRLFTALYAGVGTLGGALIGTGLSVVLARERWETVPSDRWAAPRAGRDLHTIHGWQLGLRLPH